jgi:hypothetical protein
MKKYIDNINFEFNGVQDERFFTYSFKDEKVGEIVVELSTDLDSAEIVHTLPDGTYLSYEVTSQKELQSTLEYIMGKKLVSEDQWQQSSEPKEVFGLVDW